MRRRSTEVVISALLLGACTTPTSIDTPTTETIDVGDADTTTTMQLGPIEDASRGGTGLGDRLYPMLGNGGYDVQRYSFDLSFDDGGAVEAVAAIELLTKADIAGLSLDLADLTVSRVEVDGGEAEFQHVDRELMIDFEEVVPAGEPVTIEVWYHGVPTPLPADAVPFGPGWVTGRDVAYLFSQPDGAQSLLPVNDHPSDRADVALTVHTPSGVEAVSGGELVSESSADGRDTVVWEMASVAPYLIPLAVGELTLLSDRVVNGIRYDIWVSDGLLESTTLEAFDSQPAIVAFFEERFGPYPFERAGALIVDDSLGAALETQTIPTYTARSSEWGEVVIAHEIAHQWFGDAIALEQWDDIWLNEGFATFAHWLWIEERFGTAAYAREVRDAHALFSGAALIAEGVDRDVVARRVQDAFPPPDEPRASDLFNASVYERAGLGLVALRDAVGDEALFEFVRVYTARFSGATVSTEMFVALVGEELGTEAADLIETWVTAPIIPAMPSRGLTSVG